MNAWFRQLYDLISGRSKQRAKVLAEIHDQCRRLNDRLEADPSPFARVTFWTDAHWYEYVSKDEVNMIVQQYGFGPLRSYRDEELRAAA